MSTVYENSWAGHMMEIFDNAPPEARALARESGVLDTDARRYGNDECIQHTQSSYEETLEHYDRMMKQKLNEGSEHRDAKVGRTAKSYQEDKDRG